MKLVEAVAVGSEAVVGHEVVRRSVAVIPASALWVAHVWWHAHLELMLVVLVILWLAQVVRVVVWSARSGSRMKCVSSVWGVATRWKLATTIATTVGTTSTTWIPSATYIEKNIDVN